MSAQSVADATAPPLAPGANLRWSVVRPTVERLKPATILELGCGGGGFGARLATMTPRYIAAEPDPVSYALASSRITPVGGEVINGDHTQLPAGETYDLVCAFEVLEHIDDDRVALAGWAPLVKPGGNILLSTPAGPERMGAWDEAVGHFRRYSAEQMTELLTEAGFVDVKVRLYGWPLGYILEGARNRIATRRQGKSVSEGAEESIEERTASSGRQLQPKGSLAGNVVKLGTAPFIFVQRLAPTRGTALVAVGRRPA
ncbi:class I SAM-dependent methyltransferase [Cryptosporangium sp. NPDC048952]|uniref:class I SAM-dependent methyltransferase n=1 Tax=Cryptosporangium sp. NPDC048952 TaxID=3363961 RepID=UPI0037112B8D